jgi:hypothetical protein
LFELKRGSQRSECENLTGNSDQQQRAPSNSVQQKDGEHMKKDHDDAQPDRSQNRSTRTLEASETEDGRSVIDDRVDAG